MNQRPQEFAIEHHRQRFTNLEFTQAGDKIIGSAQTAEHGDERTRRYQVLTIRDGRIIDMQDCRSRADAERFARRK
jgi:hypothetical protein